MVNTTLCTGVGYSLLTRINKPDARTPMPQVNEGHVEYCHPVTTTTTSTRSHLQLQTPGPRSEQRAHPVQRNVPIATTLEYRTSAILVLQTVR